MHGKKSSTPSSQLGQKALIFFLAALVGYYLVSSQQVSTTSGSVVNQKTFEHIRHAKVFSKTLSESELGNLPAESYSYMAMIDAGSSGCRAHVYRYGLLGSDSSDKSSSLYVLPAHDSLKVKPGLSSFATNAEKAGPSLEGLITFMKSKVPEAQWATTPIYLKATAGLRLVSDDARTAILTSVRNFLANKEVNPFSFHTADAQVIPGLEEGAFGWISVNYLKNTIGPFKAGKKVNKDEAFAVIEMGGASTQVTQIAKSGTDVMALEKGFKYSFKVQSEDLVLYSHSYLGYGADKAREALNTHLLTTVAAPPLSSNNGENKEVHDPCLNPGYTKQRDSVVSNVYEGITGYDMVGKGQGNACHETVEAAMFAHRHGSTNNKKCKKSVEVTSFDCVHQPAYVRQSKNILVFENFYYAASAVDVMPINHEKYPQSKPEFPLQTSPKEFLDSAEQICSTNWSEMDSKYPKEKNQNARWCFSTTYMYLFLTHGIGLKDSQSLTVQQSIGGADVEWALGAAYKELSDELTLFRSKQLRQ